MNITADTKNYRFVVTDPATGKKRKLNIPLYGTIKEKKQQIKDLQVYIMQCKIESKKLEAKALILEAEACRREKHLQDVNLLLNILESREKDHSNPVDKLFDRYKITDAYTKLVPANQYHREKHYAKFLEYLQGEKVVDAEQITHDHAVEFMLGLKGKSATFNKYLTNLSAVFKAIGLNNPFKGISRRNAEEDATVKEPFTEEEIKKIFKSFTGDWLEICKVAAYTGMRFSDIVHLNKSNIVMDFHKKEKIIKLTPEKTKHTGRSLYIQILPPIEFLLTKKTDRRGYFFPDMVEKYKANTRNAGASLNHVFVKKIKALKIDKTFHCFRHFFVDKLRQAGLTNEQIGSVVGHSSTKQTRDYGDYHNPIDLSKII
jgi:integrase